VISAEKDEGSGAEGSRNDTFETNFLAGSVRQFVELDTSREGVAREDVGDRGQTVAAELVGFTVDALSPPVQVGTSLEAAELQVNFVEVEVVVNIALIGISLDGDEAGQLTEFGVGLRNNFETSTGPSVPLIATNASVTTVIEVDLETNIAADLEAGFGARDVEVAGAERVADANIFHGLGLGSDDSIGSLCAGDCCESSSGAEKKALDVHF